MDISCHPPSCQQDDAGECDGYNVEQPLAIEELSGSARAAQKSLHITVEKYHMALLLLGSRGFTCCEVWHTARTRHTPFQL